MGNINKQLISGQTIKTINGESLLGSGNIEVQGSSERSGNKTFRQATLPTSDVLAGDLLYLTTTLSSAYPGKRWYRYNGTKWELLQDGEIAEIQENVSSIEQTTEKISATVETHTTEINAQGSSISIINDNVSSLEQTSTEIQSTVAEHTILIDGNTETEKELSTRIDQTSTDIEALATDKVSHDGVSEEQDFGWHLDTDGFMLKSKVTTETESGSTVTYTNVFNVANDGNTFLNGNVYSTGHFYDAEAIKDTWIEYKNHTSSTEAPSDWADPDSEEWSIIVPAREAEKFTWQRTVVQYKDEAGTKEVKTAVCIQGENGITYRIWIRYSDKDGTYEGTGHVYESPKDDDGNYYEYIGNATTADTTAPESHKSYVWSKYKGETGRTGTTYYTWRRYSDSSNGWADEEHTQKDIHIESIHTVEGEQIPYNYIGVRYDNLTPASTDISEDTDSNNPDNYNWMKYIGNNGTNGTTYYTWRRYSDSSTGLDSKPYSSKDGHTYSYIGVQYDKAISQEDAGQSAETISTEDEAKYTWEKYIGDKGDQGNPGPAGVNGANGLNGENGEDGKNGSDGVDGKDGKNGMTEDEIQQYVSKAIEEFKNSAELANKISSIAQEQTKAQTYTIGTLSVIDSSGNDITDKYYSIGTTTTGQVAVGSQIDITISKISNSNYFVEYCTDSVQKLISSHKFNIPVETKDVSYENWEKDCNYKYTIIDNVIYIQVIQNIRDLIDISKTSTLSLSANNTEGESLASTEKWTDANNNEITSTTYNSTVAFLAEPNDYTLYSDYSNKSITVNTDNEDANITATMSNSSYTWIFCYDYIFPAAKTYSIDNNIHFYYTNDEGKIIEIDNSLQYFSNITFKHLTDDVWKTNNKDIRLNSKFSIRITSKNVIDQGIYLLYKINKDYYTNDVYFEEDCVFENMTVASTALLTDINKNPILNADTTQATLSYKIEITDEIGDDGYYIAKLNIYIPYFIAYGTTIDYLIYNYGHGDASTEKLYSDSSYSTEVSSIKYGSTYYLWCKSKDTTNYSDYQGVVNIYASSANLSNFRYINNKFTAYIIYTLPIIDKYYKKSYIIKYNDNEAKASENTSPLQSIDMQHYINLINTTTSEESNILAPIFVEEGSPLTIKLDESQGDWVTDDLEYAHKFDEITFDVVISNDTPWESKMSYAGILVRNNSTATFSTWQELYDELVSSTTIPESSTEISRPNDLDILGNETHYYVYETSFAKDTGIILAHLISDTTAEKAMLGLNILFTDTAVNPDDGSQKSIYLGYDISFIYGGILNADGSIAKVRPLTNSEINSFAGFTAEAIGNLPEGSESFEFYTEIPYENLEDGYGKCVVASLGAEVTLNS